jgi:prepilin-type N-terminal cleavage/methylation domain-containing protein
MKTLQTSPWTPRQGLTLLEVIISMTVLTVLIAGVLSISVETARFTAFADDDYIVQNEAMRSVTKMSDILHKTGWADVGGITFPIVWNNGDELDFVLNGDIDGNGYAFNQATGELEWAPVIYTARRDGITGTLGIYVGPFLLWVLGSNISNVDFLTNVEDSSIQFKEIRVTVQADRVSPDGVPVTYSTTSSIHMRN